MVRMRADAAVNADASTRHPIPFGCNAANNDRGAKGSSTSIVALGTSFRIVLAALLLSSRRMATPGIVRALSAPAPPLPNRRDFVARAGGGAAAAAFLGSSVAPFPALAVAKDVPVDGSDDVASLLNDAKTIRWDGPSWSACRYGTSTLGDKNNVPPPGAPAVYPEWMEGYHAVKYKFVGASFPQGRGILSLRTAGAGLGSCLPLPNVGYNPPAEHAVRFLKGPANDDDDGGRGVYEDLAYTMPRKFESFWPQSKVLAVQTNGDGGGRLSPKCFVTGDGCGDDVNPDLHSPASRVAMEFDGPTRRGGRRTQSCDVTMLRHSSVRNGADHGACYVSKSYSQYNANQDLQTFYREVASFRRTNDGDIVGRVRVGAFLPYYVKQMDGNDARSDYREDEAVALYEYNFFMKSIDATEAASL